ncbi:MAG TPA: alpha/beta hydrolase [Actinomycetota bacterium]|jgi:pimeloyl-ACP methyl ester carboxylesterase|nr:alpha/beta hydrolase [Actinomycetota bacterium]
MVSSTTSADGLRIAFDDAGSGEPALLCMPSWCSDRSQFQPLFPLLSQHLRTVVLDWRGHGDSDVPRSDYGHEQMTEDALAVLAASGAERFVGITAGHAGWVGLNLRRRTGRRMVGLVAVSWMVLGAPPTFMEALKQLRQEDRWEAVRDSLLEMWRGEGSNPDVDEQIARMSRCGQENWMRAGREIAAAFARYGSPIAALSALHPPLPTLHIYAQPTDPSGVQAQREWARTEPWFEVQRIEAHSHFPQFELREHVAELIKSFATRRASEDLL